MSQLEKTFIISESELLEAIDNLCKVGTDNLKSTNRLHYALGILVCVKGHPAK